MTNPLSVTPPPSPEERRAMLEVWLRAAEEFAVDTSNQEVVEDYPQDFGAFALLTADIANALEAGKTEVVGLNPTANVLREQVLLVRDGLGDDHVEVDARLLKRDGPGTSIALMRTLVSRLAYEAYSAGLIEKEYAFLPLEPDPSLPPTLPEKVNAEINRRRVAAIASLGGPA